MSEMTDIEKQRGKEYSKEELFASLSAAKLEAEELRKELGQTRIIICRSCLKIRAQICGPCLAKSIESAESERDKYKQALKKIANPALGGKIQQRIAREALGKPGEH